MSVRIERTRDEGRRNTSAREERSDFGGNVDVKLYNNGTVPTLVYCDWPRPLEAGLTVPKSLAVPLMLEQELPVWRWSTRGESWERMRFYILGNPHGSRSSLFVTQDTAMALKKIYSMLVETGMYGPVKH